MMLKNTLPTIKFFLEMPFSLRQRRLSSIRSAITKDEFISMLTSTPSASTIAGMLWDKLNDVKVHDDFTPYPDDDLSQVYGLSDEDLDEDVILFILHSVKREVPSKEAIARFGPVRTPRDIVRFIAIRE